MPMNPCPALDELEALLDEQLSADEHRTIALHVSACDRCQANLERLTQEDTVAIVGLSSSTAQPEEIRSALFFGHSQSAFLKQLKQAIPSAVNGPGSLNSRTPTPSDIPQVAGYEILGELGRGGMGLVYKARQVGLNRAVALKMILAGTHARPKDLARFRQEAEAAARLRHPHIVQIYEIGEAGGNPYIALEFMEEGSLAQKLRGDPQPFLPAVRLIETLARAIHFAH